MLNQKPLVLITGASGGIGQQCALTFAQAGYNVAINYSKNHAAAMEVAKLCSQFDVETMIVQADVSKADQVDEMVKTILGKFPSIDVLINNSGITKDQLLLRMSEKDFDDVINVNLKGTFLCTKAVIRSMLKAQKGRIINMASVVGLLGNIGQANYAASKGGVIAFTKSVAKEVASRNITVNAIAPGFITTSMTDGLRDDIKQEIIKRIPLMRLGKSEDVAQTALFLASNGANYITGQVICVDGGMMM